MTIGIPALVISRLRRIPIVLGIHDIWPETLAATGMLTWAPALTAVAAFSRFLYSSAKLLTVVSPGFVANLVAKGVPREKIAVVPDWADEDVYRVGMDGLRREDLGLSRDDFVAVYAGNIGPAQGVGTVVEAAAVLRDDPRVQVVIAGDGIDAQTVRQRASDMRLDNVHFIGRLPTSRMPALLALADVLVVHLRPHSLFDLSMPSKVAAYFSAGRPVIAGTTGVAAKLVEHVGAGASCPPGDPHALADAIRKLDAAGAVARDTMGQAGRRYYLANLTRSALIGVYESLLASAAREPSP